MPSKNRVATLSAILSIGILGFLLGLAVSSPSLAKARGDAAPNAKATPTINKKINADRVDNLHAAMTPAPNRLLALDSNAQVPIAAIPNEVQRRVAGNCVVGSAVRAVNEDGTVVCESFPTAAPGQFFPTPVPTATVVPTATPFPTPSPNPADITSVTAGDGLIGGGTSGDVQLASNFAGTGTANSAARSDHNHYSELGWVKAMAHVELHSVNGQFVMMVGDCYNSQVSPPTTTSPCGITVSRAFAGTYPMDFGFPVGNRLILATLDSHGDAIRITQNNSQVLVTITGSDAGFYVFVY